MTYIPTTDAARVAYAQNFAAQLGTDTIGGTTPYLGVDYTNLQIILSTAAAAFETAYLLAIDPLTRGPVTVAAKNDAWLVIDALMREVAQLLQFSQGITDAIRTRYGITVPKATRTPVPPPASRPLLQMRQQNVESITFEFSDELNPAGKAKAPGAIGVELAADNVIFQTITKSPSIIDTTQFVRGELVNFKARYVTRSGPAGKVQAGAWCPTISLVIS